MCCKSCASRQAERRQIFGGLGAAPQEGAGERDMPDQRAADADRDNQRVGNMKEQLELGQDRPAE